MTRRPATPARRSPPVNLTLPLAVQEVLARLVAEDAAELGRDADRQRSATVASLILAEGKRRERRRQKKDEEGA